ncbi:hypothetical protein ACIBG7_13510 [Nonomuraea sp. NPDC050328]|uniref:hypothetical protein n=1 Tax=Nonomuraea sp. NPDC050328 TaxID=3364361 RepID=UPI00379D7D35
MIRGIVTATAILSLAAGALLASMPPAASGIPRDCTVAEGSGPSDSGRARCTSGTGHFRAVAYCTSSPTFSHGGYYWGPWKRPGEAWSVVTCPSSAKYVVDTGYELANW